MTTSNIRWFLSRNNIIFQVHPDFEDGTNAPFKADISGDLIRELKPVGDFPLVNDVVETYKVHNTFEELVNDNINTFKTCQACFIDTEGVVYLISSVKDNISNAPYNILCDGDTVIHCGEHSKEDGYAVEHEYDLHSISSFAKRMSEVNTAA